MELSCRGQLDSNWGSRPGPARPHQGHSRNDPNGPLCPPQTRICFAPLAPRLLSFAPYFGAKFNMAS